LNDLGDRVQKRQRVHDALSRRFSHILPPFRESTRIPIPE
jgi:hypothetical protein